MILPGAVKNGARHGNRNNNLETTSIDVIDDF